MQRHKNQLVDRLLQLVENKKTTIARFSRDTGIPSGRIYKWKDEGNNPKAEDERRLSAWLKGNNMEYSINTPITQLEANTAPQNPWLDKYIASLESNNKTLAESIQLTLNTILKLQTKTDSNLEIALAGVTHLATHVDTAREEVLKSLARLEKKPETSLLERADRKSMQILKEADKLGKRSQVGN